MIFLILGLDIFYNIRYFYNKYFVIINFNVLSNTAFTKKYSKV